MQSIINLYENCIKALDNNLTPVIWKGGIGEDMAHALVIDSIQTSDQNESFYICKNTVKEWREQFHDSLIYITRDQFSFFTIFLLYLKNRASYR